MENIYSAQDLARLWDHYVEVVKEYRLAQRATDVAEVACAAAYEVCEAAYAEEVRCARAVTSASQKFQAASDAAFLSECGIGLIGDVTPVGVGEGKTEE